MNTKKTEHPLHALCLKQSIFAKWLFIYLFIYLFISLCFFFFFLGTYELLFLVDAFFFLVVAYFMVGICFRSDGVRNFELGGP